MGLRVLVTGGAGFIGGNLCRRLLSDPAVSEVRVIDDLSTGSVEAIDGLDLTFTEASILDTETLARVARGCDAIVHLAALGSVPRSVKDPLASHAANATGSLNVLVAARNVDAHVVLASSSSVYGANRQLPKTETMLCQPMSPYAVTKLASEQYAMAFAECYDLSVLPFRFFNVYGPGQRAGHAYAAVVPVFLDAALRGEVLPVHGDGGQSRDFTFVGTLTEIVAQAVSKRVTGGPTNLAFGTRTTLNEVIDLVGELMGRAVDVEHRDPRPGDVRHSQADNGVLLNMFPDVRPTTLHSGISQTLEWMRTQLERPGSGASAPRTQSPE